MLNRFKKNIRRFIPKPIFSLYYFIWAYLAWKIYRDPSSELLVIGITGTNGKTTTSNTVHHLLQSNGIRCGLLSTANFKIGNREIANKSKMTMLGRLALQRMLRKMVKEECQAVVVEVSSEGIASYRTYGINFDILVFTNLTPEHIEAHGSFEKYKKAKQKIFRDLAKFPRKKLSGFSADILKKTIIANVDDEHAEDFLRFDADRKIGFAITKDKSLFASKLIRASHIKSNKEGLDFNLEMGENEIKIFSPLLGEFNIYNLLAGACIAEVFGFSNMEIKKSLENFNGVAGRMEKIRSKKGYDVIIDYALTPDSLLKLYKNVRDLYKGKIIAVYGSCGGGRDVAKRPLMGQIVSGYADYSILTNEDPYFDDPYAIVNDIVEGYKANEKIEKEDYEIVINREQAIEKALLMAEGAKDVVVITGKGSETGMNINGKIIPFNDKEVVMKYIR